MANRFRGEVDLIVGGRPYKVAMTLEALAKCADALGVETLEAFESRVMSLRIADMKPIVATLLEANGHQVAEADIGGMSFKDYTRGIVALWNARPDAEEAAAAGDKAHPQKRAK